MEDYELHTLSNGIRLAHKQIPHTQIAHCGLMLDIGSRDEQPSQQGLAHFWEHMAFKGTKKRKSFHIINRLEIVGGELNAYTTKEKICFHASVLEMHAEKAVELLVDIAFNSVFPEKQIEKERSVILEEMAMYYDSPEDALQDDFDQIIFKSHPLGSNILGTPETVKAFNREQLEQFINENLNTERVVFASVSKWPFRKVKKLVEKHLKDIPNRTSVRKRSPPGPYESQRVTIERPITQAQCAMGRPAFALRDPCRLPFFMLINLLGGPTMNSRLNMNLREKFGLVYSIEASYTPYLDTGFLGIYFGTDPAHLNKSISLINKELRLIQEKPLTTLQLHHAKEQLMGQLAMSEESNQSFMLMMAKSILDLDKIESLEEIFREIQQVDASLLQQLAREMFATDLLSQLTFLPEKTD